MSNSEINTSTASCGKFLIELISKDCLSFNKQRSSFLQKTNNASLGSGQLLECFPNGLVNESFNSVLDTKIYVTHFENYGSMKLMPETLTIGEFIGLFSYVGVREYTHDFYLSQTKEVQRNLKNGCGYSLARYGSHKGKLSYRNKDNVEECFGISIDIDNDKNPLTDVNIQAIFGNFLYLLYTTHTFTPDKPRYRLVMFFDEPVSALRYADVFAFCAEQLGAAHDSRAKDASRLSLYPCCPKDCVDHYRVILNEGQLFDTRSAPEISKPTKTKHKRSKAACPCPEKTNVDVNALSISPDLKSLIVDGYTGQMFKSRSEYVYYAVTNLIRQAIKPKTIFSIAVSTVLGERYYSAEDAWNDIVRIAEREKANKYGVVVGTEQTYPKRMYRNPKKICSEINKVIAEYIRQSDNCTEVLGIKASAGIGKTAEVINNIISVVNNNGYVEVYLITHDLAIDFKQRIHEAEGGKNIKVEIIYGRNSEHAPANHCIKSANAGHLAKSGIAVSTLLCRNIDKTKCSEYNNCNYRKQYKSEKSVVIYVHQHLFLKRNSDETKRKPSLIVIDESFWKTSLECTKILVKHISLLKVSNEIKEALFTGKPYDYLAAAFDNPQQYIEDELHIQMSELNKLIKEISPKTESEQLKKICKEVRRWLKSITLLKTMKADYARIQASLLPVFLYPQYKKKTFAATDKTLFAWHCIKKHKKLLRLKWTDGETESLIPTVYIDADLDPVIASVFFENLNFNEYYAKRKAKIWQDATTTNSISELKRDGQLSITRAQRHLNNFCRAAQLRKKSVLLITYKELLDSNKLVIPSNCTPIHFGGYRGIDRYKEHDACIVIGRFQIPVDAIERYGIGLWHDSHHLAIGHIMRPEVGYTLKNGNKLGMPVLFPVEQKLQALIRQLRECETLQGVDRLRLLHAEIKRPILILSNVPLDLEVDQLLFDDRAPSKINKLLKRSDHGVICLDPKMLYRDHDLFDSPDDAKQVVQRWKQLNLNEEDIAFVNGIKYKQTKYIYNAKGGCSPYCLHEINASDDLIIECLKQIRGQDAKITLLR